MKFGVNKILRFFSLLKNQNKTMKFHIYKNKYTEVQNKNVEKFKFN